MSWAFNPDNGPPRLLRFVSPEQMPSDDTLTVFDARNNILFINIQLYEQLDPVQQHTTQRATTTLVMDFA